jgi:TolB-like protein/Tfp pilus assembly protein PilF
VSEIEQNSAVPARPERRLAAILAADVVGYSTLMERDEEGTHERLRSLLRDVFGPVAERHRGRIVKSAGDGFILEFASPVEAVRWALGVQQAIAERNVTLSGDRRLTVRMGINLGDVLSENDDIFGDGVNVAARLEALAEPGGICISAKVFDEVCNKLVLEVEDMGETTLKNIARPVRTYRIAAPQPSAGALDPAATAKDEKPSIAVLPFANLSGDPDQQYFSDGTTEDIITELSRFRSLVVIARNSSFQYRDKAVDVRRVAQELGVRYVVEGSIRKMPDRIRITAQLIDARSGAHLWSERYDRGMHDLFDVQDEVTRTIVATLTDRVQDAEIRSVARKRTDNLSAHDSLLRGMEHLRGYGADDNRRAIERFEAAITLDPRFGLAHAYLALGLLVEHGYGSAPEPIKARALHAGLTGVRLDPAEGRCHWCLAQVYRYSAEYDLALTHAQRAVTLNPNDASAIAGLSFALAAVGRAEEGVELIRQAMRLNPFHPEWYQDVLAMVLYGARRYEEALEANRRIMDRSRHWHVARTAACYAQLGRLHEARAQAAEVLRRKPDFRLSTASLPYKNPADAEHVLDGMRKAGLPE